MQIHLLVLGGGRQSTVKLIYLYFKTKTQNLARMRNLPNFHFFLCNFEEINRHEFKILHDAD